MEQVVVLGGGIAGLSAAFHLTNSAELREKYQVTVYQLGWRLGGKGASGRNAEQGERIEEHGLHVWFGFYDNAFNIMRTCYEQMARPATDPLATLEQAFHPVNEFVFCDYFAGKWTQIPFAGVSNGLTPGGDHALPTFWEIAADALRWIDKHWEEHRARLAAGPAIGSHPDRVLDFLRRLEGRVHTELADLVAGNILHDALLLLEKAGNVIGADLSADLLKLLGPMLGEFRDHLWNDVVQDRLDDAELRFFFTSMDLISTIAVGLDKDSIAHCGLGHIDNEEFSDWLKRHGAKQITLGDVPAHRSPILRSMYDVSFGFEQGDIHQPNMTAGRCVHVLMRLAFTYKGSLYYKMQAGMGDTVFAPMYDVLKGRGVRFEFFHDVQNVRLSADSLRIGAIELHRQANVRSPDGYRPLKDVMGLPCWPNQPLWDQLDVASLRPDASLYERSGALQVGDPIVLFDGQDFNHVVMAIPVAGLSRICSELISHSTNPRFSDMVAASRTCMTQAMQLWVNRPIGRDGLGWTHSLDAIVGSFAEPVDTYCAMNQLVSRETWPPEYDVSGIAYFCGVIEDLSGDTAEGVALRAKVRGGYFVGTSLPWLWPDAVKNGAFDYDILVDPVDRTGRQRLEAQYFRANSEPTERYTLTPTDSVKHRLRPHESGYPNLTLAGDWVHNPLNSGCIEAAVMSGMAASRAICGLPEVIVGEHFDWLQPRHGLANHPDKSTSASDDNRFSNEAR